MLIRNAEVGGHPRMCVQVRGDRIADVGPDLCREPDEPVVEARGGMLLPGLHDHHIHLLALAAAAGSVSCGPPEVRGRADLTAVLRRAAAAVPPGGWVRGVGYHDSVAGALTRTDLDAMVPDVPVRVQHRSGAMWILNSAAVHALGLDGEPAHEGRLFRLDGWLRGRLPPAPAPDLATVGRRLAALGVTGVTDATAGTGPGEVELLTAAADRGELPQRLMLTGGPQLAVPEHPRVHLGPVKIVLDEGEPVEFDELVDQVRAARAAGRAVAVHCVTRAAIVLILAVLEVTGSRPDDRIEHGAVIPPDLVAPLRQQGLTVVTQPHFIAERGDEYLREVETEDLPWLYRCAGLQRAGIAVAAGTDAPFGSPDPWRSMRAAVERRTLGGTLLGPDEAVDAATALSMYLGPPGRPGGPPQRITPGAPADLCLLSAPGPAVLRDLSADLVALTIADGQVVADNR